MRRSARNALPAFRQACSASPARAAVPFALTALAVLGACEGPNLFVGGDPIAMDDVPPTVVIVAPDSGLAFPAGATVPIDVLLRDDASGVVSAVVLGEAFRGDSAQATDEWVPRYETEQVVFSAPIDSTLLQRILVPLPEDTAEKVYLKAAATDAAGNTDSTRVIITIGGPAIALLRPVAEVVTDGGQVLIRVSGEDPGGLDSLRVSVGQAIDTAFVWRFAPPVEDAVTRDTVLDIALGLAPGESDTLTFQAFGWNTADLPGATGVRRVEVVAPTADETPPVVSLTTPESVRAEMDDDIFLTVTAEDEVAGSGLRRLGLAAYASWIPVDPAKPTLDSDTIRVGEVTYGTPRPSAIETFALRLDSLGFPADQLEFPAEVRVSLVAFAEDDSINCGAGTSAAFEQRGCDAVVTGQGVDVTLTADGSARLLEVVPVMGRTISLPDGGIIADAAVDTARDRLYLSNITRNRIDVIDLNALQAVESAVVGSEPWGITINGAGDSLIVANSGGKNISFLNLDDFTEDRLFIPEQVLWQLAYAIDEFGDLKYSEPQFFGFSDRPQFIAQDSTGTLLFSTVPTPAASDGTIRRVTNYPTGPEPVMLLFGQFVAAAEKIYAIANVDDVDVIPVTGNHDLVTLVDHVPGTTTVISATDSSMTAAAGAIAGMGSDVEVYNGSWDLEATTVSDTTFVAASGNRGWIGFGEGATAPTGRVLLWDAATGTISDAISTIDLIDNASERVLGLGLNMGGGTQGSRLVGVARGQEEIYFFDRDLALLGVFSEGIEPGGAGATLHPDHDAVYPQSDATVAFVASGNRSVKTIGTVTFNDDGLLDMPILNEISGPLRAARVAPDDALNSGLSCPGADPATDPCIVVRLYGVVDTDADGTADGVVVINVRQRDIVN